MTKSITAAVTFRHGTQGYTQGVNYPAVEDSLAHLFMKRNWATGETSGSRSLTMLVDWREGAEHYLTDSTYTIDQPLADFLIETGAAVDSGLPIELLDQIAAAPENSWIKANTNKFSDVWPASDYRPFFSSGPTNPATILNCWASFGWDDENCQAIFWGGGHANGSNNEVYTWGAKTQQWGLAFYPADVVAVTGGMGFETVDWPATPESSHTYDTQQVLPKLKRFITFGGAAHSSGGAFKIRGTPDRNIGCFMLDMTEAGTGKVGGTTGSNVKRGTTVGVTLEGANAWSARDWYLDHADPNNALSSLAVRTDSASAYREENGHDVIYYKSGQGALLRFEFVDHDYHNDIISVVGKPWTTLSGPQGGALDLSTNRFVAQINSSTPFSYWNLDTAGPNNIDLKVMAADLTGPDAAEYLSQMASSPSFSLEYDERRQCLVSWSRGGRVYAIDSSTWSVTKLSDDSLPVRPMTGSELSASGQIDTGVNGKWRRSKKLDCYIGVQKINDGDIWIFKPAGWVDPRS